MKPPKAVTILTHQVPHGTEEGLAVVIDSLVAAGIEVRLAPDEVAKHDLKPRDGVVLGAEPEDDGSDLAVVLGGDGTTLHAMRAFAGREVPVFAFNFGAIGFLATVEKSELEEGIQRVIEGNFDVVNLPALAIDVDGVTQRAVNDVSLHRRANNRVAELAYSVEGDELGEVRCDGLVASTPAGSTGYNLANGGPVLAWGVEGYVVSFIAPHTLTARTLVVATDAMLSVANRSDSEPVDVTTDGRMVSALGPGELLPIRFEHDKVQLAQKPGSSYYHRLQEKFGKLAY